MALAEIVSLLGVIVAPNTAALAFMWNHFSSKIKNLADENVALKREISGIVTTNELQLAVWSKDEQGRILWVSPRAMLLLFAPMGMSEIEVIGKTFGQIFGPDIEKQIQELDTSALTDIDSTKMDIIKLSPKHQPMLILKTIFEKDGRILKQGVAFRQLDVSLNPKFLQKLAGMSNRSTP